MSKQSFILILIVLVALVARFRYLTEIEHNVDHAYTVWQAMTTLDRGEFPLAGQGTSVLFANPPLTGYLLIPAMALTRSPLGVYVFIIALNTLAVWFAYRAVRGLLGPAAGLITAALLAVNPWVIEYSRTSWVQALLPFFVAGVAWLLWPVLHGTAAKPGRRIIAALVMTALLAQTYLLAYFILAPVALLLVVFRRRIPWRAAAVGGAVIVLTTGLYGVGLLNQFDTVRERLAGFTDSGETRLDWEAWEAAVRLVTGSEYELARGLDAPIQDADLRHDLSRPTHLFLLTMILLGMGAAVYALVRGRQRRDAAVILLVWFGLPVVAMSFSSNPVHTFYQLLGVPAGGALAAWGLSMVFQPERWPAGRVMLLVLFVPLAALMLTNSARYYQETEAIPGAHDLYALPVDVGMQMGAALDSASVVYGQAEAWILNSFAGRLFPVVTDTRAPAFNFIPRDGGAYVTIGEDVAAPHFGTEAESIALNDGKTLAVYTLPPAESLDLPGTVLNIPTQQGLTLLNYTLEQDGDDWLLTTFWRVEAVAPEVLTHIYTPFLHVHDAADVRVLNLDGAGLAGFRWSVGDLHVHQMRFTLPAAGAYTLRVGQFDGANNANLVFLPPEGDPGVVVELPEVVAGF